MAQDKHRLLADRDPMGFLNTERYCCMMNQALAKNCNIIQNIKLGLSIIYCNILYCNIVYYNTDFSLFKKKHFVNSINIVWIGNQML